MAKHTNLTKAKTTPNDEFYTRLEDIEAEISSHPDYVKHFKDKVVLCNCDDPEWSNFYEFFRLHFKQLGLKKLITTHFNAPIVETEERPILDKRGNPKKDKEGNVKTETVVVKETLVPSYKLEWYGEMLNDDTINMIKTPLNGNGDFRSEECVELLKEADIVVTNPPFSIAREDFIPLLFKYKKDFVIIGDLNWITYKSVFPLLKDNKMWFGYTTVKEFKTPDGSIKKFGNKLWFTNLDLDKRHESIPLTKNYKGNESSYPSYFNFNGINVDSVKAIPKDYNGVMGVPITFLGEYNPEQFEIVGLGISNSGISVGVKPYTEEHKNYRKNVEKKGAVDGDLYMVDSNNHPVVPYARILIRKKAVKEDDC